MSIEVKPVITDSPYEFDVDQNGFPVFTKKNFALMDALLRYDSKYSASEDANDPSTYAGMLKANGVPTSFEAALPVVKSIDRVNSTFLNLKSDGKGIEATATTVSSIKKLKDRLVMRDDKLIDEIASAVITLTGKGKYNFSFATKFCAYTCIFADGIQKDNYCIYDGVLAGVLPYYAYLYAEGDLYKDLCRKNKSNRIVSKVESLYRDKRKYTPYRKTVNGILEGILKQSELEDISYKEFDQLIWYYFKGDDRKIDKALACIEL